MVAFQVCALVRRLGAWPDVLRSQGSADREACFSILTSTLGRASADPTRSVGVEKFDGDVARMTQRWRMVRCCGLGWGWGGGGRVAQYDGLVACSASFQTLSICPT